MQMTWRTWLDSLETMSRWKTAPALFALLLLVAYADYWTGDGISLSVFYLPLVSLACWIGGLRWGVSFSLLASGLWLIDDFIHPDIPPPDFYKYWQTGIRFSTFAAFALVVARLHEALERETLLARHDHLTGLYNSQGFCELASRELSRARRNERPLSILYFDCDNFKHVNDTYGHAMGDTLLRAAASAARGACRNSDVVARAGGDEFVVLLPETGLQAVTVAEHIQHDLRAAMRAHGWPVSFSMGVMTYFSMPESVDDLLGAADRLMYQAKQSGKDRLVHQSDFPFEPESQPTELLEL